MDRFSLLLLEPGEIYFCDVGVSLHNSQEGAQGTATFKEKDPVRGRLKICSKSLVFVPQASPNEKDLGPLLKFPLADCTKIQEWFPKSFQSKLAKEANVLSVTCTSFVEMLEKNQLAPFKFLRANRSFLFALKYAKLDDYLPLICQLQRAATLPPVEQNGMVAAMVYSTQNRVEFDACFLDSVQENILFKTVGNKINPLVINPGRIVLSNVTLYFQPYNNAEEKPVTKVKLASIKRIFQRRYLLRPLGLEIEYTNFKEKSDHIYLTFNKPEDRQKLYHRMIIAKEELKQTTCNNFNNQMLDPMNLEHPLSPRPPSRASPTLNPDSNQLISIPVELREENMTLQWQNGLVSNFDYLMYLNSAADRSFNDLTQYPVMPWVIADYTSRVLDLDNPASYRDLSKPMGALNEERLLALKERAHDMPEPRFLYGSHYSTPGFVLYFLVRKIPECMLCLQNGKFDHPDRMFNSIPQTWINVTTRHSDFKELVPEFYMPENKGDFLVNYRQIDFGVRHCGTMVGDVELPPWAKSPSDFVETLRRAIESDYVSKNIHLWIDLIFGYKQRGRAADQNDNLFYHLCYEGSVDLDTINDLEERYALEVQIGEFGQVPKQLFHSPHPQRLAQSSDTRSEQGFDLEDGEIPDVGKRDSRSQSRERPRFLVDSSPMRPPSIRLTTPSSSFDDPQSSTFWKHNVKNLRMVCDFKVHREAISTVALSVDNLWVFSSSHDNILKMYSLEEMQLLRSVPIAGPDIKLSCCIPLSNNKTVLLGSWDQSICAYSIEYGRVHQFNGAHRDAISCMDWRSGILATGSWDATVKIWQCNQINGFQVNIERDFLAQLDHNSQVTSLNLCPAKTQLVSGTRDGNVVLWCLESFNIIQELPAHTRQVNGVSFSPDTNRVVSCGSDFFLKVIDLKTGTILFSKDLGEELNCLAFDGRTVLVGGGSGYLSVWDIHTVKFQGKILAHKGPVTAMWVSQDGDHVATGGDDRRVVVWTSKSK